MDAKYFLLYSKSEYWDTPELHLFSFDQYSELWQYLQDLLFLEDLNWYQIFWGDTLIMQRNVH